MSNDTPGSGDPRDPGERPAQGEPPPAYPPSPPGGGGYGDGSYGGNAGFQGGGYAAGDGGGGGYQQWPHEAPPGTGPRHKDPRATSRGVRAAAYIFGAATLLHLLTLAAVAITGGDNAGFFLLEGMFVVVAGLIAAIVTTVKLPMDSRAAFWISGFAFMALQFIIWGVTCGVGFSISPLNIH